MGFKIADFFADIKIQGDTLTLKTMANTMADMKLETIAEIGALGALGLAFKNVAVQAMQLGSSYTSINKEYGTNINLLQRWQNVARASNVPVDAVAQTFTKMQSLLASPLIGNPNSGFMRSAALLGINNANRMTAEQLNEALRVAVPSYIRRQTPTQGRENAITNAGSLIEQLGATRSMMQLYMVPNAQFQQREMNSPVMSDRDVQNWTELSEQVSVLGHQFFMLGEGILAEALPGLLSFGRGLLQIMQEMESFLGKNFKEASAAAEAPWGGGKTDQGDVVAHAIMSWLIPNIVKGNADRRASVTQNNNVNIHTHGSDPAQTAAHSKREFDRTNQHHLTKAALLVNDLQAW